MKCNTPFNNADIVNAKFHGNCRYYKTEEEMVETKVEKIMLPYQTIRMEVKNHKASYLRHILYTKNVEKSSDHHTLFSKNTYVLVKYSKHVVPSYYVYCSNFNEQNLANLFHKEIGIRGICYSTQMQCCNKTLEIIQ